MSSIISLNSGIIPAGGKVSSSYPHFTLTPEFAEFVEFLDELSKKFHNDRKIYDYPQWVIEEREIAIDKIGDICGKVSGVSMQDSWCFVLVVPEHGMSPEEKLVWDDKMIVFYLSLKENNISEEQMGVLLLAEAKKLNLEHEEAHSLVALYGAEEAAKIEAGIAARKAEIASATGAVPGKRL